MKPLILSLALALPLLAAAPATDLHAQPAAAQAATPAPIVARLRPRRER